MDLHIPMSDASPPQSADFRDRFSIVSSDYARFRPAYPEAMVQSLASHIVAVSPSAETGSTIDVGCGTGIFTRQLAATLPAGLRVVGVEPARGMREAAIRQSDTLGITFLDATAEALPVEDGGARAVVAATAAHWFDRPRFYAEAARVLMAGGILAIVEYVRDVEQSPAAAAIEDFLAREGGPKAYSRPDYVAELGALEAFDLADVVTEPVTMPLDMEGFVGLALSSSHARPVVAKLGESATRSGLARIGADLVAADGTIPYGYRFQLFVARRVACNPSDIVCAP